MKIWIKLRHKEIRFDQKLNFLRQNLKYSAFCGVSKFVRIEGAFDLCECVIIYIMENNTNMPLRIDFKAPVRHTPVKIRF